MNRRSYLATLGALGAMVPLAGCAAFGEGDDSSTETGSTVEPGETAILSIEATDVEDIRFNGIINGPDASDGDELPEILFENAEFTPTHYRYLESYPPVWDWSSPVAVEGEVPVQTNSDTPPGTYEFPLTISKADSAEDVTKRPTVTVE